MTHVPMSKLDYIKIYAALLGLLALTVGAAFIHLGSLNMVITLGIAITKALLVVVFFMHARFSEKLTWLYATLGVLWSLLLIGGVLMDIVTRN